MVQELKEIISKHKVTLEERNEVNERELEELNDTLDDFIGKLKKLIEEAKHKHEAQSSVTFKGREDPPQIDPIKKLLGKLKSLIPERWWSGSLREILDKILENLSPQDPEEVGRLLCYVEEVYGPGLNRLASYWGEQMRIEAYEDCARRILKDLLEEELP